MSNHNALPSKETFQHQEMIQFSDGRTALGFRTKGDVIEWGGHKYADPESSAIDTAIVKTESGKRYALGKGVMVELPDLDTETGEFGKVGEPVKAIPFDKVPTGLTDITVGETWDTLGGDDPVSIVMLDYKASSKDPAYAQLDMPNPFDSARGHIDRVAQLATNA